MSRINKPRLSPMDKEKVMENQRQMEEQLKQEAASKYGVPPPPPPLSSVPPPPPPPPLSNSSTSNDSAPAAPAAPAAPSEPKPHIPIYNPMAKRSTPVNAGTMDLPSTLIPNSVKKQVKEKPAVYNPFLSSLPMTEKAEADSKKEEKINVPGPQLRFTLVPYGADESDQSDDDHSSSSSSDDDDENGEEQTNLVETEEKKNEVDEKEDAFSQFMKEISSM